MNARLAISLFLVLAAPRSQAQERRIEFPPYEVTASRLPSEAARTPGSTTVLDRDDVERLHPSSTAELLASVPGLHVISSGALSVVHLRGADPNFTMILIDGVQVNDPTDARGGAFDLATIDPADIERVEIVRGPASAVQGSSAMAGVIQITTRARGSFAQIEGGQDESLRLALGTAGALGGLRARMHRVEDADDGRDELSRMVSGYAKQDFGTGGAWQLDLRLEESEQDHYPENSGGPRLAAIAARTHEEGRRFQTGLRGAHSLGERTSLQLQADVLRIERDVDDPGIFPAPGAPTPIIPPSTNSDELLRWRFNANLLRELGRLQLGSGAELQLEDGTSDGDVAGAPTDFARYRRIGSLFGEAQWNLPRLTFEAALRMDATAEDSPHFSPRVAAQLRPNARGTRIKASYAEGFKLASFFALGHPFVGDPDFGPERSENFDLAVVQSLPAIRAVIEVGWFHTRYLDLIDFDDSTFLLVQREEVRSQGIEAAARVRLRRGLDLRAELSQARTEIQSTGDPLTGRPEWKGSLELAWTSERGRTLTLRSLLVGEVPAASIPTGEQSLAGWVRFDLSGRWPLERGLQLYAAVENLSDQSYEQAIGFPAAGISSRLGIRADF